MAYTRGDLCNRVLSSLQILGTGQTASAEDTTLVDGLISPTMSELYRRGVVFVADLGQAGVLTSGDIPASELIPISQVVAKAVATDFGLSFADFAALATDGEGRLRAMQAEAQTFEPIRFTPY